MTFTGMASIKVALKGSDVKVFSDVSEKSQPPPPVD